MTSGNQNTPEKAPGAARYERACEQWREAGSRSRLADVYNEQAMSYTFAAFRDERRADIARFAPRADGTFPAADFLERAYVLHGLAEENFNLAAKAGEGVFGLRLRAAGNLVVSVFERIGARLHLC